MTAKLKIKKGDNVQVIAGKDSGKTRQRAARAARARAAWWSRS